MEKNKNEFKYLRIAEVIERQILNNTLRAGDKIPSLRTLCREYGVSQNTALNAYYYLEGKMLIEARPQSGYYVSFSNARIPSIPKKTNPSTIANHGDSELLVSKVYGNLGENGHLALSLGTPANELLPIAKLNKALIQATRDLKGSGVASDKVEGNERLRRQIARWAFAMESHLTHEDIITTSGCLNALSYCMMAVAEKGDTVAMESPVSFGMLQLAEALGIKVLELPTHPQNGVDLNAFEDALKSKQVKASLLISNFSNPLGSCMADKNKETAVILSEKYNKPLIENDINGDVYFGKYRPKSCKTFDKTGIVLWCGSISKTLAPGYRVGWVAPGKFKEKVLRLKLFLTIASTSVTQEVIANFLETGRYENHLRKLRATLHGNMLKYSQIIGKYFPERTMASRPQGGFVIWVELPVKIDTMEVYEKTSRREISYAPGRIFSLQNQYNNCLRLNYGLQWNNKLEYRLIELGNLFKNT
ncbi:PLP-dependent aminotransferase family protein [Zunongwangia sp. F363]|uniref:PLP-dependent aminotransferase family protein n=1 Tax=Autumnicola tepida TaxID=3075595 RepID=A0ABU3CEM8_9FLAO|nr:PLP-dependent aminotransferase family protein [Zunongwangia sp. F363]MDT0644811.1 PLP-dependent aminotransferase family protein [Zunongwangia sp. F363]